MLLRLTGSFTDNTLPVYRRDKLLSDDNGGVLSLFDMGYKYSYAGGNPTNGSAVKNINESGNDSSVILHSGQTLLHAGNGFDFSSITKIGTYLQGPASVAASIWGNGTDPQYFMACAYFKLPTAADWNADGAIFPMLGFGGAGANESYTTHPELVLFAQSSVGKSISIRRQTAIGSAEQQTLTPSVGEYGNIVQLSYWRNATSQTMRIRSAERSLSVSFGTVGANNTANFSALTPKYGIAGNFVGLTGETIGASRASAVKYRLYRSFIENLRISGRDPVTVLDADYVRTMARGVFS